MFKLRVKLALFWVTWPLFEGGLWLMERAGVTLPGRVQFQVGRGMAEVALWIVRPTVWSGKV